MDRRDFLKLFAITAAGIYIPKRSYFFMPKQFTEVSFRGKKFLIPIQKDNVAVFHDDGFLVPSEYEHIVVKICNKTYQISGSKLYTVGRGESPMDEAIRKLKRGDYE